MQTVPFQQPSFQLTLPPTSAGQVYAMPAFRGERFVVDLSDEDENVNDNTADSPKTTSNNPLSILQGPGFVKDVTEKPTASLSAPSAPQPKSRDAGFPTHRRRTGVSKFKQLRSTAGGPELKDGDNADPAPAREPASLDSFDAAQRREIDRENTEKLSHMSAETIAKERQELLENLSPSLIQRLLQRANIDSDDTPTSTSEPPPGDHLPEKRSLDERRVRFMQDEPDQPGHPLKQPTSTDPFLDDRAPMSASDAANPHPPTLSPPSEKNPPELDPSHPDFLTDLHEKYFPDLPADPSRLAWMSDPSTDTAPSPYSPANEALAASSLRFSFRGLLLPPRTSLTIPTTAGLHHHGDAPLSAGYTIPELAHLARSAFPAQRCLAFQTLGRVLYRLGRGKFGPREEPMAAGLWDCIEQGRVIDTLEAEAARGTHVSAKAYAVEALWLWRQGGGAMRKAE